MVKFRIVITLFLCFSLIGCATMGSLDRVREKSPKKVLSEVYPYSSKKVFQATRLACLDVGLAITHSSVKEGKIYAQSPASVSRLLWVEEGYGEKVGIYLTELGNRSTSVEVVLQKAVFTDIGYKDYRGILLNLIRTHLQKNKSTK